MGTKRASAKCGAGGCVSCGLVLIGGGASASYILSINSLIPAHLLRGLLNALAPLGQLYQVRRFLFPSC